ncbi:hypothetical protein PCANB_000675 [Pneumocystis canis]|nr:hypothetical protein PCK1_000659 [Pneumocystis canis]KAG5437638.1 hypothetical protein PCANB_000675 [Pneumocystis canis]
MSEEIIELRYMENEDQEFSDRIILIELTDELLELLKTEKTSCLTLKPDYDRHGTVLCSPSKTYFLRDVSQTNSLLLFQHENDGFSLLKDAKSYLEIIPIPVRINFKPFAPIYDGYNLHVSDMISLYTLPQVKRRIPASDEEIHRALTNSMCLVINGYLRQLSFNYILRVLQLILANAEAEEIPLDKLKLDVLMVYIGSDELKDVVELILRRFSRTQIEPYVMDGPSIARWIGIQLLAEKKGISIPLEDFIQTWKSIIPSPFSMHAELSLLQGEYILTGSSSLRYFPADMLPMDPALRFHELFLAQPKWNLSDILPFVRGLETDETKIDALLRKFARKQNVCEKTIVTARNLWK